MSPRAPEVAGGVARVTAANVEQALIAWSDALAE